MKNSIKLAFCITFSTLLIGASVFAQGTVNTQYRYNRIKLKQPVITKSMIPAVTQYKQGNYLGAMVDLKKIVEKEKNNTTAKYYLALCYTQLGYESQANEMYKQVVDANDNYFMSYYSQRAIDCTGKENKNDTCKPHKRATKPVAKTNSEKTAVSDIEAFIESGVMMDPSVIDRITKDRMERKIQAEEYQKKQQDAENNNANNQ